MWLQNLMWARVGSSCCLLGGVRSAPRAGTGEAAWTVAAEFCRCHICAPEPQERAYQSQKGKPLLQCLSTSFCWQRSLPAKQRKALKNLLPLLQSRQIWVLMDMGAGRCDSITITGIAFWDYLLLGSQYASIICCLSGTTLSALQQLI